MNDMLMKSDVVLPPWTVEGHADPRAWFVKMHEQGPIQLDERSGVWMFYGWEAVKDFLSEPDLWSIAKRSEMIDDSQRIIRLLTSDPPIHKDLRRYFARAYRPGRIAQIEQAIRDVSANLLKKCVARGTFDVVADFMKPLAVITICEVLGIPSSDEERIAPVGGLASRLGLLAPADADGSILDQIYAGNAPEGFIETIEPYFNELIARRRAEPRDDLISDLTKIDPDALNGQVNIPALLFEQFGAGTNTTVHLFVSLLSELRNRPHILAEIRENRSLIPVAIDEAARLHSPLQARPRVLTRDTTIDGRSAREGAWGLGWLAAANLDPTIFPDPLAFDLRRRRRDHLAFGRSEHFCLGTHLGKMELKVAMNTWLDLIADFDPLADEIQWVDDFILRGADHYRVEVAAQAN